MSFEQQVQNAWYAGVLFLVVAVTFFVLTHRSEDHGRTLWQLWRDRIIMSRQRQSPVPAAGMEPVYIPVSQYGMDAGGMEDDMPPTPDIDAVDGGMPRLSRNITDGEMIVLLAAQRGKDGKHRFSANAIHELVGGDRNTVLAKIKAIRATPPPAEYMQPDGTRIPASHPVTGQRQPAQKGA